MKKLLLLFLSLLTVSGLVQCDKSAGEALAYFKLVAAPPTFDRFAWKDGFSNISHIQLEGSVDEKTRKIELTDNLVARFLDSSGASRPIPAITGNYKNAKVTLTMDLGEFPFVQGFFLSGRYLGSDTLIVEIHITNEIVKSFDGPDFNIFINDLLFCEIVINPDSLFKEITNTEILASNRSADNKIFISVDNNSSLYEKVLEGMKNAFSINFKRE